MIEQNKLKSNCVEKLVTFLENPSAYNYVCLEKSMTLYQAFVKDKQYYREIQASNSQPEELKDKIILAINRGSLSQILDLLENICLEADQNYPGYGWRHNANLISSIQPKIK